MEDGDFLKVRRGANTGYTEQASLVWADDTATIRIRRFGNQLIFDWQDEPGEWINLYTRPLPGDATASSGGIFAATETARNARFEFDYVMVIDPNLSNDYLESLRITEIMYNDAGLSDVEFIELTNVGTVPINLEGVTFDVGSPFDAMTLPNYSLMPGRSVILTNDSGAFIAAYGTDPVILAQWPGGRLSNAGEKIVMRDPDGNVIHDFSFDDGVGWPAAADGAGFTLGILDPQGDYTDPANWTSSENVGGSPLGYEFGFAWDSYDKDSGSGAVTIRWKSHPLRSYTVETTTDMVSWTPLITVAASGTGITTHTDTAAGNETRRIYRVKIEQ
jgi:hypothetical protein